MYRIISRPPPRDDSLNVDTPQDNAGNHADEAGGEEAEEAPSVPESPSNERETSVLSVLSAPDSELPQSASASEIQSPTQSLHSRSASLNDGTVAAPSSPTTSSSGKPWSPDRRNADGLHECPVCTKGFQRPSGLSTHMNIHNRIKPYECGFKDCDAKFAARSNARRHRHTHGAEFVRDMDASERAEPNPKEPTFVDPIVADPIPSLQLLAGDISPSRASSSKSETVRWMPVNLPKRHHRPPKPRAGRRGEDGA
ncbi:hypothetical protein EV121DRAFT_200629 [Schizophyllum commune]